MNGNYLVFKGDHYYPCGGWVDFEGAYETLEEAKAAAKLGSAMCGEDWSHIVDLSTGKIIEENRR